MCAIFPIERDRDPGVFIFAYLFSKQKIEKLILKNIWTKNDDNKFGMCKWFSSND